jgi:hypothetical protein
MAAMLQRNDAVLRTTFSSKGADDTLRALSAAFRKLCGGFPYAGERVGLSLTCVSAVFVEIAVPSRHTSRALGDRIPLRIRRLPPSYFDVITYDAFAHLSR